MFLDAVSRDRTAGEEVFAVAPKNEVFGPWADRLPSEVLHHGKLCCKAAREWLISTAFSFQNGADLRSGPRWLRHRFKWGPSDYPIHWCEAVRKRQLDCGALAAFSQEIFSDRGVTSYRALFVQRFSTVATEQWSRGWESAGISVNWIEGDLIYHEGVAVLYGDDKLKVWDSSAGWWVDPRKTKGYGSVAAIRVFAPGREAEIVWGEHRLRPGHWTSLESA